jgi:hypothetical protein
MYMSKLEKYIKEKYDGAAYWFIEYVQEVHNQSKVNEIYELKNYLEGHHKILNRPSYKYNGKDFEPRKIVLSYAKTLLNFQKAYLLQNPITLTGNENVVKEYQKVQRKAKYDRINMKLLDKLLKYGEVYEYVYYEGGQIKSKLIEADQGYALYDTEGEMIAFVQAFMNDGIHYYTVFEDDVVTKYNNADGEMKMISRHANLSGLPVAYVNSSEWSELEGRSELADWIGLLDNMEDLLSKFTDSFYKHHNPIPVITGQQLKGEGLPKDIVGGGIQLDDGNDFKMVSNQLDYQSFESVYKTLLQSLLDVSQTPAVSLNKTDISNLSEVSIKLLYQLASIKAGINEQYVREGMEQRFEKIRKLLEYKGIKLTDDEFDSLDMTFQYAQPQNDKEIIENLKTLSEIGSVSLETVLENSPYVSDVGMEMERLNDEGNKKVIRR